MEINSYLLTSLRQIRFVVLGVCTKSGLSACDKSGLLSHQSAQNQVCRPFKLRYQVCRPMSLPNQVCRPMSLRQIRFVVQSTCDKSGLSSHQPAQNQVCHPIKLFYIRFVVLWVLNHKLKEHLLCELSEVIICNRFFCPACQLHA